MNHRPIVLPGVATGAVLLAALVGFVHLPADASSPAAPASSSATAQADISMCRSVAVNTEVADWDTVMKGGDVASVHGALNNVLGTLQEQVTSPTLSKEVQQPLATFFAAGVRTFNGIASTQAVTKEQIADLNEARDEFTRACDAVGA